MYFVAPFSQKEIRQAMFYSGFITNTNECT